MAEFEHIRLPEARIFNAREFGNYDTAIDFEREAEVGAIVAPVDEEAQEVLLNESNQVLADSDELREIAQGVADDDVLPMCGSDSDGAESD
ncbi:TPA: hypothetical protein ACH3X1_010231 [Trebouxia sp. C0004]